MEYKISGVEVVLVLFVHIVLFCDGASEIALMGSGRILIPQEEVSKDK